ncbi:MAG: hypothetical protein MUE84_16595 [Hyphomonas sp.]|jgi:quercetin dioxygenase-like cupin family protein|nr:hypothetical protein [Hyphomonas sp.]
MNEDTTAGAFAEWPRQLVRDLEAGQGNGNVGTVLVSETDKVRVWHLVLAPGESMPFHTHVLDYFWTVIGDGKGRSHFGDGTVREVNYRSGDTKHLTYRQGERMTHNLENIGDTTLSFVTVEFKSSANSPIQISPLDAPGR